MNKKIIWIIAVIIIAIAGLILPKLIIHDAQLEVEDIACAKRDAHWLFGAPFDRLVIIKMSVVGKEGNVIYVNAYTFGGLKYAEAEVVCDNEARVVWRRWFRNPEVVCTMEAKICPDGSSVGRIGPNCEFAKCPFGNDQVGKSITDYLLTQKYFSWKTTTDSRNFCVIENLNPTEEGLFPLYVWTRCGEFILQNGKLKELSGLSVPAKINYPNELSFYDLNKFSYEVPRDGLLSSKDIKTIFPLNVQRQIADFDSKNINSRIEAIAVDWFRTENSNKEICADLCGDGICQELVCMAIGCPCSETPETCPSDCKQTSYIFDKSKFCPDYGDCNDYGLESRKCSKIGDCAASCTYGCVSKKWMEGKIDCEAIWENFECECIDDICQRKFQP